MMPRFDERGQLPPGIHRLAWSEFTSAFGYNDWRRALIRGMRKALANLKRAGCLTVYIDGSFVTRKPYPGDYDGCWDADNVDEDLVDPVLLDMSGRRRLQKWIYGGEMFPLRPAAGALTMLEYFQRDKRGNAKGIVMVCLGDLDD